ncbi:MAG: hypothetical protein PUI16_02655 [Clostridia bacterium]|nr:hypothetical protein [Clostridia bacterium]MDY5555660.1 hypothetical protein [Blautia sp.]
MIAFMKEMLDKFLAAIISVLPLSPFADAIDSLEQLPYLGYINYFIPVGTCIKIGEAWLAAIALFYLYSVLARWIKLIE